MIYIWKNMLQKLKTPIFKVKYFNYILFCDQVIVAIFQLPTRTRYPTLYYVRLRHLGELF